MKDISVSEGINIKELIEKIKPNIECHKGSNGKVLIVGGSKDYFGAPILACLSAFRFVDVVGLFSVEEVISKVYHPEIICFSSGKEYLSKEDVNFALKITEGYDVVLIGNGLSVNERTKEFVNDFVSKYEGKIVLDADALKILEYTKISLKDAILTPNKYEYDRYVNKYEEHLVKNNTILIKGRKDVIKYRDRDVKIKGGSPSLCKAGTGDVLSGLIAGIYTHNLSAFESAVLGSYLMKKISLVLEEKKGFVFTPLDLIDNIRTVLH